MRRLLSVLGVLAAGIFGIAGSIGHAGASPLDAARTVDRPTGPAAVIETTQYRHSPWRSGRRYHSLWRSRNFYSPRHWHDFYIPWRGRDFYHDERRSRGYLHNPWRSGRWY